NGGFVVAVPPQYTSQTCPCCGHVSKDNRQTQARFECVECGFEENADLVGAINILARGHRVLACGGMVQSGHPAKQEPTEATHRRLSPERRRNRCPSGRRGCQKSSILSCHQEY
ncbi:transposase, partial [Nitrosomonas sp.]|uniref:transposase n=1 Tax=Nitrosomonas sp. TaxID=42353 RepID=UPI0025F31EA2